MSITSRSFRHAVLEHIKSRWRQQPRGGVAFKMRRRPPHLEWVKTKLTSRLLLSCAFSRLEAFFVSVCYVNLSLSVV
jgi:hypothetical protein